MAKVSFFYANGTSYAINILELGISIDNGGIIRLGGWALNGPNIPSTAISRRTLSNPNTSLTTGGIYGLNGKTYRWNGGPANDPFPQMLNPDVWNATRISYPASTLGMGPSINTGITQTIAAIRKTAPGTPFALGGYSQGAAVMSTVYNEIRNTTGSLYSRRNDFIGGVMFGNPRRQLNYRGEIGGTWSGAWDVPGSTTGGHGSFPATGTWARLGTGATGNPTCDPTKWIEFTAPDDIFSSTGDSTTGLNWSSGNNLFLNIQTPDYFGLLLDQVKALAKGFTTPILTAAQIAAGLAQRFNFFLDAASKPFSVGGLGHTSYPFLGPPNNDGTFNTTSSVIDGNTYLSPVGSTCYQLALAWLESKATAWATAPVIVPTISAGWSTTLKKPVIRR